MQLVFRNDVIDVLPHDTSLFVFHILSRDSNNNNYLCITLDISYTSYTDTHISYIYHTTENISFLLLFIYIFVCVCVYKRLKRLSLHPFHSVFDYRYQ